VRLWGTLLFGTALAGAGLASYVRDRKEQSGQTYLEILRQLPSEARRGYGEVRRRAQLALGDGLQASRDRGSQVERALTAAAPRDAGPAS
jgi:hypothetical protein